MQLILSKFKKVLSVTLSLCLILTALQVTNYESNVKLNANESDQLIIDGYEVEVLEDTDTKVSVKTEDNNGKAIVSFDKETEEISVETIEKSKSLFSKQEKNNMM